MDFSKNGLNDISTADFGDDSCAESLTYCQCSEVRVNRRLREMRSGPNWFTRSVVA